jgi:hypothetical protein
VSEQPLSLTLLSVRMALCRLPANAPIPPWTVAARTFLTISRTPTELSITADEAALPAEVEAERGYRILRVEGPLPLNLVGVFARLAAPLASAGVPIFPIATFDTDYILIREPAMPHAIAVLRGAGHIIAEAPTTQDPAWLPVFQQPQA